MRLLVCAGGTGGGVYPALAVLQALRESDNQDVPTRAHDHPLSILWVGGEGGMEADLVKREGLPYRTISAAGIHGVGWRALPGNLVKLYRGYRQSQQILKEFHPDVLFFTGGYLAVPMAVAGRHIPSVLYVPDIEPGLALKTLARFAHCIAITSEDGRAYYPKKAKVYVTGYPVRPSLRDWRVEEARQKLGLRSDMPTLLVFGGSKGARSINRALIAALPKLLPEMQIIHISGKLDWSEVQAAYARLAEDRMGAGVWIERYRIFEYLHEEMGAALTAADIVLSRAGASTLGEYPLSGLPAVLVPYPYAWRYQQVNAQYLAKRGAAVIIQDADLAEQLAPVVLGLIRDSRRREEMKRAMRSLACPDAARSIAQLMRKLVNSQSQERMPL